MPFSADRFNRLLSIKTIKQQDLAKAAAVAQSQISDCTKGVCRTTDLTERLARALDCTPDFLLDWSFPGVDEDVGLFRAAVAQMAYDAFAARINLSAEQKERCRRVLHHKHAPLTQTAWAILSEQIELAIGPNDGGAGLHLVRGA